eukprot:1160356-Pelagomonas_calceolata.AAC.9
MHFHLHAGSEQPGSSGQGEGHACVQALATCCSHCPEVALSSTHAHRNAIYLTSRKHSSGMEHCPSSLLGEPCCSAHLSTHLATTGEEHRAQGQRDVQRHH